MNSSAFSCGESALFAHPLGDHRAARDHVLVLGVWP